MKIREFSPILVATAQQESGRLYIRIGSLWIYACMTALLDFIFYGESNASETSRDQITQISNSAPTTVGLYNCVSAANKFSLPSLYGLRKSHPAIIPRGC